MTGGGGRCTAFQVDTFIPKAHRKTLRKIFAICSQSRKGQKVRILN